MYHLTPVSVILFVIQILSSISSWILVIVGPFYKSYNKDFRKEGLDDYSPYTMTHIGTWTENKVPEMFVPAFFIPLSIIFPFLGMFLVRNCFRKNLSAIGKIVLIVVTIALYSINGASIHYAARNISLNKQDTIHIGWLIAAGLNWFATLLLLFNVLTIYCCEISSKNKDAEDLSPSRNSGISGMSGSLSGASGSGAGSNSRSGSRSGTRSKSTTGSKISSAANSTKNNQRSQ